MQRLKNKISPDEDRHSHKKTNDEESDNESQEDGDDELRALYLDKEKQKEYILNPKETQDFSNQDELKGSDEYSANLSKDHTNHFNEEVEQGLFSKIFNALFAQKILALLTALLSKLATITDLLLPSLAGKSKSRYGVVSALLKLLIKIQMSLSLRLMQMILLINKKLIEIDEKYIGGSSSGKEKKNEVQNITQAQNRERSREQYRSFEIGNLDEQRRSEYLKGRAFNQNRDNNIISDKGSWTQNQNVSISLSSSKSIDNKFEESKYASVEKDSIKKSEDFAAKYVQKQEYLRITGVGREEGHQFSFEGSLLSKLFGIAKVVYNSAKEFIQNKFSERNEFNEKNTSRDKYEINVSYGNNEKAHHQNNDRGHQNNDLGAQNQGGEKGHGFEYKGNDAMVGHSRGVF